jgi:mono/diheme cytochrome c family protein
VQREWLEAYLKRPRPIRPSGAPVGSGARMPDYRLSSAEVTTLADQLMKQREGFVAPSTSNGTGAVRALSRFSQEKARGLLTEKLSCLGCHRLNGVGGRIGPDLSDIGQRLKPDYLHAVIEHPRALLPDSMMPDPGLSPKTRSLIASYLLQQSAPRVEPLALSFEELSGLSVPVAKEGERNGAWLYAKYCAACHGESGAGDGFNAPYLLTPATNHRSADVLSRRSDATLYDAIGAGGRVMDRSHQMPAWRGTLSDAEITALVTVLRGFCGCVGPAWSREGTD